MSEQAIKTAMAFADAASLLLKTVPELYEQSVSLKNKLAEFKEQNRNPTQLEWQDIDEAIDSLHKKLDSIG